MTFSWELLRLDRIDWGDRSFVASFGFPLDDLEASIRTLGLLSPPLLRVRQEGGYQIVCGYRRLLVLQRLQQQEVPARVVPAQTPDAWCLEASIQDNAFGRGFNPLEAALMIQRLQRHFPEDVICRDYLPRLGLPPARSQLPIYLALLDLELPWQELVAQGRLSPPAGAALNRWDPADRQALLPWFQAVSFSHSKQLELLEHLATLSRRQGRSPAFWLSRPEITHLAADPARSGPEKSKLLLELLRRWRFPRASQTQEQFQGHLQTLGLWQHPDIHLTPSPAFEESLFRLELRFRNTPELARRLQQIEELLKHPDWDALMRL